MAILRAPELNSGSLRDSVDALYCDQVTVDYVRHPEPADAPTVIIAPMERFWRVRILGQGRHRSTDLAHPVLIF
jgi:hypothetical protein